MQKDTSHDEVMRIYVLVRRCHGNIPSRPIKATALDPPFWWCSACADIYPAHELSWGIYVEIELS